MAAVSCSYSGEPIYTGWYDSTSRGYLDITGVSYETTTGQYTISWALKLGDAGNGRYNFIAGAASIDGTQVAWDHASEYGTYWTYTQYSNGTTFKSGTFTTTKTSVSLWCKVMFNYGYTDTRWNNGTGCVSASGTLTITPPTIGNPTISLTVGSKTSASRGGSTGSATISASVSAGTNGGNTSYSISCNSQSSSNAALSLTGLKNNTSYSYSGSVSNSAGKTGSASGSFYLTPVAPTAPSISSTTPSRTGCTINLSSSYDTLRKFSKYDVSYGTSTSYGSTASSTTSGSVSLSGLQPNTTYYYSITTTDANNSGAYSTALTSGATTGSFKTTCNAPSSLTISRSSSTTTGISVTVSATGDTNAAITNYTLYYRKGTSGTYSSTSLGTSTSKTVSGLDVDTDYQFYFTATNAGGTSTSSTVTYSTLLNNPTISALTSTNLTPFTVTISTSGSVTPSRTLQYRFSKDNGSTWTAYQSSGTYNWTGLSEETTYQMKAQVKATHTGTNASDTTATSAVLSITTPADQAKIRIKKSLPSSYTRLEYLQATGTQYIDTGFGPDQDTRAVFTFQYDKNNQGYRFFGTDASSDSQAFRFGTTMGTAWLLRYNNIRANSTIEFTPLEKHTVDMNKNVYKIDEVIMNTFTYSQFTGYGNAYIFSVNSPDIADLTPGKLFSCIIYDNGKMIRYFIPAKRNSDNVLGLYDLVYDTFYTNAGSGSFIAGPALTIPTTYWLKGKTYFKKNGTWQKAKKVYIKKNGAWIIGTNYDPE